MAEKILILDFGSQYTQLIARAVREANVYCEITPFNKKIEFDNLKGIILAGSPFSVNEEFAPYVDVKTLSEKLPVYLLWRTTYCKRFWRHSRKQ